MLIHANSPIKFDWRKQTTGTLQWYNQSDWQSVDLLWGHISSKAKMPTSVLAGGSCLAKGESPQFKMERPHENSVEMIHTWTQGCRGRCFLLFSWLHLEYLVLLHQLKRKQKWKGTERSEQYLNEAPFLEVFVIVTIAVGFPLFTSVTHCVVLRSHRHPWPLPHPCHLAREKLWILSIDHWWQTSAS